MPALYASLYAVETATGAVSPQFDSPLAQGVVKGLGDRWALGMGHVEARSSLEVVPGMQVVSSGLDPEIPFGLVIGTVETAEVSADSDLCRFAYGQIACGDLIRRWWFYAV